MRSTGSTHQRGVRGEDRAAVHLRLRGWRILERNFRVPSGEIDLVARRGSTLAFVEVKMRRSRRKGRPLEAVPERKVHRLSCAAACYIQSKRPKGVKQYRFDVVGVGPEKDLLGFLKLEYVKNAFEASRDFNV